MQLIARYEKKLSRYIYLVYNTTITKTLNQYFFVFVGFIFIENKNFEDKIKANKLKYFILGFWFYGIKNVKKIKKTNKVFMVLKTYKKNETEQKHCK